MSAFERGDVILVFSPVIDGANGTLVWGAVCDQRLVTGDQHLRPMGPGTQELPEQILDDAEQG